MSLQALSLRFVNKLTSTLWRLHVHKIAVTFVWCSLTRLIL